MTASEFAEWLDYLSTAYPNVRTHFANAKDMKATRAFWYRSLADCELDVASRVIDEWHRGTIERPTAWDDHPGECANWCRRWTHPYTEPDPSVPQHRSDSIATTWGGFYSVWRAMMRKIYEAREEALEAAGAWHLVDRDRLRIQCDEFAREAKAMIK